MFYSNDKWCWGGQKDEELEQLNGIQASSLGKPRGTSTSVWLRWQRKAKEEKKQKEIFRVDVATVRMFLNHRQEGTAAIYSSWTWADTRIQELGTVIMSRTHDSQMKQGRSCPSGSADCWDTGGAGVSTPTPSLSLRSWQRQNKKDAVASSLKAQRSPDVTAETDQRGCGFSPFFLAGALLDYLGQEDQGFILADKEMRRHPGMPTLTFAWYTDI